MLCLKLILQIKKFSPGRKPVGIVQKHFKTKEKPIATWAKDYYRHTIGYLKPGEKCWGYSFFFGILTKNTCVH